MKRTAIVICALTSIWTAGPVFASTNTGAAASEPTAPISAPRAVETNEAGGAGRAVEATSYAAREKAAPQLANFKGGDSTGIYIGGSTLAVVLLIVLLVILL